MKKILLSLLFVALLVACGGKPGSEGNEEKTKLVLGVVGEEYKYWNHVVEKLAEDGIELEIKVFNEYPIPNRALADGDIDINAFQHYRYFNEEVESHGYDLVVLADTFNDPLGIYTTEIKSIEDIKEGASILIPDDVSNSGRALKLLEDAGLITVDPAKGYLPTIEDITENPLNLDIKGAKADLLPALLEDVDLAVINGDLGFAHGLSANDDAIYIENIDFESNPAAKELINILAVRNGDETKAEFLKIKEYFQSEDTIKSFNEDYNGAFVPAWNK